MKWYIKFVITILLFFLTSLWGQNTKYEAETADINDLVIMQDDAASGGQFVRMEKNV